MGLRLPRQFWDKSALDIMGIRAGHAEVEGGVYGDGGIVERGRLG